MIKRLHVRRKQVIVNVILRDNQNKIHHAHSKFQHGEGMSNICQELIECVRHLQNFINTFCMFQYKHGSETKNIPQIFSLFKVLTTPA